MICSMTAFAREERQNEAGTVIWELRSVNHRYLDVFARLPEDLRSLDPVVRARVGAKVRRGKVECVLRYKPTPQQESTLRVNRKLARQVAEAAKEIDSLLTNRGPANALDVLRWPGVVETPPLDPDAVCEPIVSALDAALAELAVTREREGRKIAELIRGRVAEMEIIISEVRRRLPAIIVAERERLTNRLAELKAELDAERLEQEMVIFSQKIDVAEELDRLDAHLDEVRRVLDESKPVGRRLDFLMQELHREANTLGSKSVDTDTTRASVDLKVLIEQMREQIQNVE